MTDNRGADTRPPKLRQVWPPLGANSEPERRPPEGAKLQQVRRVIEWRAARSKMFGSKFFADPAWDIMLQAYAFELANRAPTLVEMASATGYPVSTVRRWLSALQDAGFVRWQPSSETLLARVRLTDGGIAAMHALFELLPTGGTSTSGSV